MWGAGDFREDGETGRGEREKKDFAFGVSNRVERVRSLTIGGKYTSVKLTKERKENPPISR